MTDEKTVITNFRNGEPIDRLYGGEHLRLCLIQQDGTEYKGKIYKKSILEQSILDGSNFRTYVYVTEDNRVFDRSGFPVYNIVVNDVDVDETNDMEDELDASQD